MSEVTPVEISRETVPWQNVADLAGLTTADRDKWVSKTLKLDGKGKDGDRAAVRLKVLLALSATLSRPQQLEANLQQIAELVLETMDLDRSALFLLKTPWTQGEPLNFRHKTQHTREGKDPSEPSMTVITRVLQDEEGLLVRDALVNNELGAAASIMFKKIRTCICVPLKTQTRLLGVLYADAGRPGVLHDQEDVEFFSAFAALAAIAVENNLLLTQVQAAAVSRARFERFFPPNTLEAVVTHGDRLAGRELAVTVMFCDIRNYTAMSAERNPREVAGLLNRYFQTLVPIVFRLSGTLEKYIGDALVAIWGAPVPAPTAIQARQACKAALEIQSAIAQLNQKHPDMPLEVGIGIHHGNAYVGTIGDDTYMQYAAIGATTNLAARICARAPAREILVSREVATSLDGTPLHIRSEGMFDAKGFSQPIEVFRIAGS